MRDSPDYVYEKWMRDAYDDHTQKQDKQVLQLLEDINDKIARMNELLERMGRIQPAG